MGGGGKAPALPCWDPRRDVPPQRQPKAKLDALSDDGAMPCRVIEWLLSSVRIALPPDDDRSFCTAAKSAAWDAGSLMTLLEGSKPLMMSRPNCAEVKSNSSE